MPRRAPCSTADGARCSASAPPCSTPMRTRKAARGAARLRRPDLPTRVALLEPRGVAPWVLFKLDGGSTTSCRRGAGHQPRAMGSRRGAGRGVLRRRGRAAQRRAHRLRGRRREAVDLQLPGRRPAKASPTMRRHFDQTLARPGRHSCGRAADQSRSARRRAGAGRGRRGVRRATRRGRRGRSTAPAIEHRRRPRRPGRAGRALAAGDAGTRPEPPDPGRCRSTPRPATAAPSAAGAAHRRAHRRLARTAARCCGSRGRADPRRRHHGAGAPAQRLRRASWCAR